MAVEVGSYTNILDIFLIAGIKITVASHTGVAKEILIFQISAVAPTEYLESDDVFSWFQIVCQVEFSFQFAVFAVSHIASVYPKVHIRSY